MTKFETKLNKLIDLSKQVELINNDLTKIIETHLGENWFLTDSTDGFLIISPDDRQYEIKTYLETQAMTREVAIRYIQAKPFN